MKQASNGDQKLNKKLKNANELKKLQSRLERNLKKLMVEKTLTDAQKDRKIGLAELRKIAKGKFPNILVLQNIAKAYDTSIDGLLAAGKRTTRSKAKKAVNENSTKVTALKTSAVSNG